MDQLWAIRKDFDPLPARVFIKYNFFAILRCTAYLCPYCSVPFRLTWGQKAAFLGDGEQNCWRCGKKFWDNSQEWPEMSGSDRRLFLIPISVAGWLGGTIVMGAIAVYAVISGLELAAYRIITSFLLVPLLLWFGFRGLQIVRSVHRFKRRVDEKVA